MSWANIPTMPPISEDGVERAAGLFDNDDTLAALQDSKLEALMVSMLDQRDKLTDQLQKSQRRIDELEDRLRDSARENDSLRRQMELQAQHLPAVGIASTARMHLPWVYGTLSD